MTVGRNQNPESAGFRSDGYVSPYMPIYITLVCSFGAFGVKNVKRRLGNWARLLRCMTSIRSSDPKS